MLEYIDPNHSDQSKEPNDPESIQKSFARHLEYSLACTRFNFTMQAFDLSVCEGGRQDRLEILQPDSCLNPSVVDELICRMPTVQLVLFFVIACSSP